MQPSTDLYIVAQTYIFGLTLIFTIVGAIILFRTLGAQNKILSLQIKTFESQQKVTELESKRFLYEIRPVFKVSHSDNEPMTNDGYNISLETILLKNVARDCYVMNKSKFMNDHISEFCYQYLAIDSKLPIYKGHVKAKYVHSSLEIEIRFSDEIGTDYYQIISGSFFAPQISPPFLVA